MFTRFTLAISLMAITTPAAAQCERGAWIEGTPALMSSLREALRERGAHVLDDVACAQLAPVVEVTMSADERIHLVLHGPGVATAERDVERMTTAALLVESWAEAGDLDLLEPAHVEAHAEVPEAPALPVPPTIDPPAPAPPPAPANVATVTAGGIAAFGNEGSSWFGARLGACAHAGPTCIGGGVQYLSDSGLSDGTPSEGGQRTSLGADVDLSLPFVPAPGFTLVPAVALGLAWLDVIVVDGARSITTDAMRALVRGSFAGAVAMLDWLSLELQLAVTWSPLARQAAWMIEDASVDPDPVVLASVTLGLRAEIR